MKQFMLTYAHLCSLMLTYLQKFNPLLIGSLNCTISCPYMRSVYKVTYYTKVISETLLSLVHSTLGFLLLLFKKLRIFFSTVYQTLCKGNIKEPKYLCLAMKYARYRDRKAVADSKSSQLLKDELFGRSILCRCVRR